MRAVDTGQRSRRQRCNLACPAKHAHIGDTVRPALALYLIFRNAGPGDGNESRVRAGVAAGNATQLGSIHRPHISGLA
ncbi:hypothetical protein D3C81_731620 [compost metagenome]